MSVTNIGPCDCCGSYDYGDCACNDGNCCWSENAYITGTYQVSTQTYYYSGDPCDDTDCSDATETHTMEVSFDFRAVLLPPLPDAHGCCIFQHSFLWSPFFDPKPAGLSAKLDGVEIMEGDSFPASVGVTVTLSYKCSNRGCTGNWSAQDTSATYNGLNQFPQSCFSEITIYGCSGDHSAGVGIGTIPQVCLDGDCTTIEDKTCDSRNDCYLDDYAGLVRAKKFSESLTGMTIHNNCCRNGEGDCEPGAAGADGDCDEGI